MSFFDHFHSKTAPAATLQPPDEPAAPGFLIEAEVLSDVGCVRDHNEDCVSILHERNNSRGDRALVVVADGMGGHNAGEVASAAAVKTLENSFAKMRTEPAEHLKNAFLDANASIHKQSLEEDSMRGMGTTCTALLLQDGLGYSAHVGDSRLYLIRNGGIYQLSEDHSAVMELVTLGEITMEQARHHPDKNVITRSIGGREQVEVSTWAEPMRLRAGDRFLLCSDGMYDYIEDEEIRRVATAESPLNACRQLVDIARERGGGDNISVVIVELRPLDNTN
jgi:protein phosphatase